MRSATICAIALLLAGCAAAAGVGTVRARGWRIVAVLRHDGNHDSLSSVVATGPGDAWALGQPPQVSAPIPNADVEHWNGTTWRRVPVPPGTSLGDSSAEPLAASSASDAWIFPGSSAQVGSLWYYVYDYALHWNGTAWHASGFPAKMIVQSAADLGPGDVWAFGTLQTSAEITVPYTARYNGRAWQQVKLPVAPMAIGTVGRHGLGRLCPHPGVTATWCSAWPGFPGQPPYGPTGKPMPTQAPTRSQSSRNTAYERVRTPT
jgi:hypothetical protein